MKQDGESVAVERDIFHFVNCLIVSRRGGKLSEIYDIPRA